MNSECIAARVFAALISSYALISSPVLRAAEVSDADLLRVETLENGQYQNLITVELDGRVERLLMSPNSQFNNLHIVNTDGAVIQQTGTSYSGIVGALPNSWARVLIDGDYIAGTIHSNGNNTHFSSESTVTESALSTTGRLLTLDPITPPVDTTRTTLDEISVPVADRLTATVGDVTRVIKVGMVVDTLYQEAIAGRGLSKAIATMNSIDGLYREKFGLALKTEVVVLITDEETLPLNGEDLEANLNLFRDYRRNAELLPSDLGLVHLFSGVDTGDEAVGLAFKGAACRTDGYDVSMSRPFLYAELLTAHEIAHNLGADHDDATTDCADTHDHLMFSSINADTTRDFSSCSVDAINTRMEQSTCFTSVIDIELDLVQLESNQIQINVTNLDETRAFPSAVLSVDLENAAIAEAPRLCTLEETDKLTCEISATFPGDTQNLAIKLRLEPGLERTVTVQLEPIGFFDLNETNNSVELIIEGEPQPLAVTEGEIIRDPAIINAGANASANDTDSGLVADDEQSNGSASSDSSGGGASGPTLLAALLLLCGCRMRKRWPIVRLQNRTR